MQASLKTERNQPETGWKLRLQEWWFRNRALIGYAFIFPWFAGFIIFDALPFIYNLYLSFTDYQIGTVGTPPWIGIENYSEIFSEDKLFGKSMYNTVYYLGFSVPLRLVFAFLVALILNLRVRGMELYRTLFYVPSVVPLVAATVIFAGFLNTRYGFLNQFLVLIGATPVRWLSSPDAIKPSLILLSLWGFGGQMIIFLAGLQSIPEDLYEAAAIGRRHRLASPNLYHRPADDADDFLQSAAGFDRRLPGLRASLHPHRDAWGSPASWACVHATCLQQSLSRF